MFGKLRYFCECILTIYMCVCVYFNVSLYLKEQNYSGSSQLQIFDVILHFTCKIVVYLCNLIVIFKIQKNLKNKR